MYMYDLVKLAPGLIDAILKYKKRKKIEKISDILIEYHDKTPETFAKFLLFGYLQKSIKKKKIKILSDDFNPSSLAGSSALNNIKDDLRSYFYLLIEIISKTDLPIKREDKKKGLLKEYVKLKKMSAMQFYNTCLNTLKLPEKKDIDAKIRISTDKIEGKDNLSNLLPEEKSTLGYFLIRDDLYGDDSFNKDYFWSPFYENFFPSDYVELNARHDLLIRTIYPKNSLFNPVEVVKSLISKNLLEITPGSWSSTGKTYYLSTVSANSQLNIEDESLKKIIFKVSRFISNLIQSVAEDDTIMVGMYLLEQKVPLESIAKIIGPECKRLVEIGFKNQHFIPNSWRVIFNPDHNEYNLIEEVFKKNTLRLIAKIKQRKQSLLESLTALEKHYISIFSVGELIIDKKMGQDYTERTIKKYRAKIEEIVLNYYKALNVLITYTGEPKTSFKSIHNNLISRGILWLQQIRIPGYLDVHKTIVNSFLKIEPTLELKEKLTIL